MPAAESLLFPKAGNWNGNECMEGTVVGHETILNIQLRP